jgi:hypothetical protein
LRAVKLSSLYALASPIGLADHSDVVYLRHDAAARAILMKRFLRTSYLIL